MTGTREAFAERWRDLCARAGLADADGSVLADLLRRYTEPHRHYHTVEHVLVMLDRLQRRRSAVGAPGSEAAPSARDRSLVPAELAAFFHDVVYDPRGSDNEAASARYAGQALRDLGTPQPLVERTQRLIEVTATHEARVGDPVAALLVEADLCVLARPEAAYDAYVAAVRAEYAHVDEDAWRVGRAAVLTRLQQRPALFLLPGAEDDEARARANLERELRALRT